MPWFSKLSGLDGDAQVSRFLSLSFMLTGLVLIVSMMSDHFFLGALLIALPGILFLIAGCPVRIISAVFALQIVLTIEQLNAVTIQLGMLALRPDDILTLLMVWLWVLSLPDSSMKGIRIGLQGYVILAFLAVFGVAAYRGMSAGFDSFAISTQLKPYGGYVLYFPLLWILSDEKNGRLLWKLLLGSAVLGGLIYTVKGYMGHGANVDIRETTGVRVSTRQPNAIGAIMLMFIGRLWKNWKERPALVFIVPSLILMGYAIILSQTRGIWGGFVLALASAWILNLFRKKDNVKFGRKLLVSLTTISVMMILIVFAISAMGILSASNIAERTRESGQITTSTSTLARFMAWNAIVEDLSGRAMITGKGLGAVYTCFRPDIGAVTTVYFVDSSYFQVALNMGLVGVLVFFGIFVVTMVRAARLFRRTESRRRAGVALGIFCAVVMLLFAAGFASILTNYRFTMLWALLPAMLQTEIMREKREQEESSGPPPLQDRHS